MLSGLRKQNQIRRSCSHCINPLHLWINEEFPMPAVAIVNQNANEFTPQPLLLLLMGDRLKKYPLNQRGYIFVDNDAFALP